MPTKDEYEKFGDRAECKTYRVTINGINLQASAQSLGQVLRRTGDLRLKDTDVVTVRLEA